MEISRRVSRASTTVQLYAADCTLVRRDFNREGDREAGGSDASDGSKVGVGIWLRGQVAVATTVAVSLQRRLARFDD